MTTCVAFLRAINVTGRFVKMADLAAAFQALGHADARTYIQSGNVVFSTASRSLVRLQQTLERELEPHLGFRSEVFVRTVAELQAIVARGQTLGEGVAAQGEVNVCFLQSPLTPEQAVEVRGWDSDIDRFEAAPREVFWLCQTGQSQSRFSNAVLERRLRQRSTLRRVRMLDGLLRDLER